MTAEISPFITLNVRYFAALRETLGMAQESLSTHALSVAQLRAELMQRDARWATALGRAEVRAALNHHLVSDDHTALKTGDEVAFFPPMTGG